MSKFRIGHSFMRSCQEATAEHQRQLDGEPDEQRSVKQHEGVKQCLGLRGDRSWSEVLGILIEIN